MQTEYIHIRNAYVARARKPGYHKDSRTLVIETDVSLPQKGLACDDPQLDTLLTEIHNMKGRYPDLFDSIDNVEIRERQEPAIDVRSGLAFITVDSPTSYGHAA